MWFFLSIWYEQDADEGLPDFANMTEEEQIAFAMQMSMQDHGEYLLLKCAEMNSNELKWTHFIEFNSNILKFLFIHFSITAEEVPTQQAKRPKQEEQPMEVDEVISDPEFLQSVLENLPGVDPQSETIRDAVGSLNKDKKPANKDSSNDK